MNARPQTAYAKYAAAAERHWIESRVDVQGAMQEFRDRWEWLGELEPMGASFDAGGAEADRFIKALYHFGEDLRKLMDLVEGPAQPEEDAAAADPDAE
jgi:hypothetical protein